jgi:hypothetical protein
MPVLSKKENKKERTLELFHLFMSFPLYLLTFSVTGFLIQVMKNYNIFENAYGKCRKDWRKTEYTTLFHWGHIMKS